MSVPVAGSKGGAAVLERQRSAVAIDPDIQILLEDTARLGYLLPSEAYKLGVIDGRKQVIDESKKRDMKGMMPYAEAFYDQLKKIVPEESILQHRIGIDEKTGVPTSLSVISAAREKDLENIRHMARSLELALFQYDESDYSFWVTTDNGIDQELVEQDFPYYRSNADAVK
ncbi:hypothetical protein R80B4_00952 [Fibrobacteres bacterium R8-0-B4]